MPTCSGTFNTYKYGLGNLSDVVSAYIAPFGTSKLPGAQMSCAAQVYESRTTMPNPLSAKNGGARKICAKPLTCALLRV